jgi:hypothetical protein
VEAADSASVSGGVDPSSFGFIQTARAAGPAEDASLRGSLDAVGFDFRLGWVARGWAIDDGDPDSPLDVEIVEGTTVLGRGSAAQFREDLKEAGIGSGAAAFAIELPWTVADREPLVLSLRCADSGAVIVPPAAFRIASFVGHLDRVDSVVVVGWACDAARIGAPISVEIMVDGEVAGHAVADQFRRDLAEIGLGNACYGFEWLLPSRIADGQPHQLRARIANTEFYLDGAIADLLLSPDRFAPELRRLLVQREVTRQQLSVIEQELMAEARRPRTPETLTITDLLLDRLDPPPVFYLAPSPEGSTGVDSLTGVTPDTLSGASDFR